MSDMSAIARMVCLVAALVCGCYGNARADCFGELGNSLARGGYTGGLDCELVKVKIQKIGSITISDTSFDIYELQYRTISQEGTSPHGGQRLLFFRSPDTYVGQYSVSGPPALAFRVEGKAVLANVSASSGNKIALTSNGPPEKVFLNEELVTLYK